MLKVFRRFVIISFVSAILTMAVFVSFNTPKVVKAEVISAVALGVGALAVLTASYFSVAGIQITNNGGSESYVEGWYNDIIQRYKQADIEHQQMVDTYFNSNGEFIGTEDDLQFVLSDQAYGYWQMGKGVNALMEDIKSWFVNTFSVSSTSSVLDSVTGYKNVVDGNYYPFLDGSVANVTPPYSFFSIPPQVGDSFTFEFENGNFFCLQFTGYDSLWGKPLITYVFSDNGALTNGSFMVLDTSLFYVCFVSNYPGVQNLKQIRAYSKADGSTWNWQAGVIYDISHLLEGNSEANISLDGALTDGYQDYQDALNQDLSNESENDDAVVQVGVGALPGVLTGEQVVADLLEQAAANTLEGTYEGVYENQEEATEDKEGEKEFVPEVPEGWVVVNGLEDFFPFCIPFDFYNLVTFFDAPPEAPVFEFDIELGGVLGTHHIELDFSTFDLVARIFRVTVVIGFIVFLILATRSRFIRG